MAKVNPPADPSVFLLHDIIIPLLASLCRIFYITEYLLQLTSSCIFSNVLFVTPFISSVAAVAFAKMSLLSGLAISKLYYLPAL